MTPLLGSLDWRSFLARPRLASPSVDVLDALYRKSILITGAGGSIGSALAKRLADLGPPALVLLDGSESRLYKLEQTWASAGIPGPLTPVLGNVGDATLLDEVFSIHIPSLVFHTAAYKQVALLEEQPLAAIRNNAFGTLTLCRVAQAHGARVVMVSTDKAVQPASIMGATKRLAELIVLAAGGSVLRLGNVLASRDSVTETFAMQLALDRPLTITDPAARRFFLTLDEAVNLLLIAASEAAPALLAPEIAAPIYISDLAHFMAEALAPGRNVEIDFTAPRPGDKDPDRFWSPEESPRPAIHAGLLSLQLPALTLEQLEPGLQALDSAVSARDLLAALGHLRELVPDYTPGPAVSALAGNRVMP
ncbi:MAG TPA: polysaccharide biosynthesis protein [Terracidiphilus sp.]|nr:polysaccharide biosynthesis protein [Terracidiphilus sp.]